jgi:protein phosphatase 2C family protein 2/3
MMTKGHEQRNPIEGVDIRFGYEISRDASPLQLTIVAVILPHNDLILEESIQMKFIHSSTRYGDRGGVLIQILDEHVTSYFPQRFIREKEDEKYYELSLPWLESKRAYPLSVWFYSVRNLLKLEKLEKWRGSPLLHPEFREIIKPAADIHSTKLFAGVGRNKGRRNYMEDQDFVYESINIAHNHHISVFGVLDGHGGIECSQYGVEEIPMKIAGNLRKNSPTNPIPPEEALFRAFAQVDREFLYSYQGSTAGSTANVILYDCTEHMCYIANTGDTRAILSRDQGKEVYDLSYDRKATDPEEIARIARSGGFVEKGRVLGSLAVSRALGDALLKLDSYESVLICDPEITGFLISQRDDFMVIASDGLWDVMSSQDVATKVHSLLLQDNVYRKSFCFIIFLSRSCSNYVFVCVNRNE